MPNQQPGNSRMTWGRRVLLCTTPQNPAGALASYRPKSVDNLVDTGNLPRSMPIHVAVRFSSADITLVSPVPPAVPYYIGGGAPRLPFGRLTRPVLGNGVGLTFYVRRGTDPLAPTTVDTFFMPIGADNYVIDQVPFDIFESQNLAIDVEMTPGILPDPGSALWVEAVATSVDYPAVRYVGAGYNYALHADLGASHSAIVLAPGRAARRHIIIVNTSTNANLWVLFGDFAVVGSSATFVLPANSFAKYEADDCYTGFITGIWDALSPNGKALVTEGLVQI